MWHNANSARQANSIVRLTNNFVQPTNSFVCPANSFVRPAKSFVRLTTFLRDQPAVLCAWQQFCAASQQFRVASNSLVRLANSFARPAMVLCGWQTILCGWQQLCAANQQLCASRDNSVRMWNASGELLWTRPCGDGVVVASAFVASKPTHLQQSCCRLMYRGMPSLLISRRSPKRRPTGSRRNNMRSGTFLLRKALVRTSARGYASKSAPGLKNVVLIDGCRIPFQPCTRRLLLPAPHRPAAP